MTLKLKCFSTLTLVTLLALAGCSQQATFQIHQKPIQFDSTRAQLSIKYMDKHYGMQKETPTIDPKMVVVHWTAIPTFKKSYEFFYEPKLGGKREDIQDASMLNVSTHYMIKRNGEIYQLLADTLFARHVIGLNHAAIGIENIGSKKQRLTDAQLRANTYLINKLAKRHNIEYLIGHYEYTSFEGHPLWKEQNDSYRTEKIDPGKEFMRRLRTNVRDLQLKGAPESTAAK